MIQQHQQKGKRLIEGRKGTTKANKTIKSQMNEDIKRPKDPRETMETEPRDIIL